MFEKIKNDKDIIDIYNKVSDFEKKDKGWAHHDYNHVNNVSNLVKIILKQLNYDNEFIEEVQIAAILHDTGCVYGKKDHSIRSYEYAKEYLNKKNIHLKREEMVLDAIKNHSNGFDSDNVIALTLILADKLDIKKDRITDEGLKINGNRQYQYIYDITIKIIDNSFIINFVCDDKIDLKELEDYYFTDKVFKAIRSFSRKMKLNPKVSINNKRWELFYQN